MNLYNPYKIIIIGGYGGHFAVHSPRQGPRDPPLTGVALALLEGDNGARTEALAEQLELMGFSKKASLHASYRRAGGRYPSFEEAVEKALEVNEIYEARQRERERRGPVMDAIPPDYQIIKRLEEDYGFPHDVSFDACWDPRELGRHPTFEEAFGKALYLNEKYQAAEAERLAAEQAAEAERLAAEQAAEAERRAAEQAAEAAEAARQAEVLEARRRAAEAAEARMRALSGNQ